MRKEPKHPVDAVFERALSHRTSPPHTATWEAVRAGQDKPLVFDRRGPHQELEGTPGVPQT